MKSCLYFSLLSSVLVSGSVYAACTPSPDCASLGYTATSCPDGGVKCPFDTSKWYCPLCDNVYQYDCVGTGYAGGVGTACSGKYASCNCASGFIWSGGTCKRPSGKCCHDGSVSGCGYSSNGYSYCKQNYDWADCGVLQSSCESSGGTPHLRSCGINNGYYNPAEFDCDY